MTAILLAILAFLMYPWVFWGLFLASIVGLHLILNDDDCHDFSFGAATLTGLVIAALAYRYDSFLAALVSWPSVAYLIGGYIGVGALIAGYKYLMVLIDFRPKARAWLAANKDYSDSYPSKADALSRHVFGSRNDWVKEDKAYKALDDVFTTPVYYPDWRAFPLANWWVFWPLFSASVVLDPLWRAAKRAVKWAGLVLERVAKRFAVS